LDPFTVISTYIIQKIHADYGKCQDEREIVLAFKESTCREIVVLDPKKSVKINIIDGVMKGTEKAITLNSNEANKTKIDVVWNLRLSGFKRVFELMLKKHIKEGTQDALTRIANAAT
jgi:hypothetical protein